MQVNRQASPNMAGRQPASYGTAWRLALNHKIMMQTHFGICVPQIRVKDQMNTISSDRLQIKPRYSRTCLPRGR